MINRRGLLKTILFAPAVIPSVNLMGLSWRSSKLLAMPPEPGVADWAALVNGLNFQIEKTIVQARSRKLSARWTFEVAQNDVDNVVFWH